MYRIMGRSVDIHQARIKLIYFRVVEKLKTRSILLNSWSSFPPWYTWSFYILLNGYRNRSIMFLFSPVAILVINRSLHAQKPRQDVDKHPESQSEAIANELWPMRGPTCVSRVSLCESLGSGSEYWAPPPSLRCCNIKIHQTINQKWGTGELSRGERGIDEAKVRLETNSVFASVCKVWEMEVNLYIGRTEESVLKLV